MKRHGMIVLLLCILSMGILLVSCAGGETGPTSADTGSAQSLDGAADPDGTADTAASGQPDLCPARTGGYYGEDSQSSTVDGGEVTGADPVPMCGACLRAEGMKNAQSAAQSDQPDPADVQQTGGEPGSDSDMAEN